MKSKIRKVILYIFLICIIFTFTNVVLASNVVLNSSNESNNYKEIYLNDNIYKTTFNTRSSINLTMQNRLNSISTYASSSFDLRDVIDITVKDQKSLDSCWAVVATSAVETNMALKYGYSSTFSPRHMEYATSKTFLDGTNSKGFNREVNDGGSANIALGYLTNGSGMVLEKNMPYTESTSKINLSGINKEVVAQVKEYKRFATIEKQKVSGVTKYYKEDGTEYTSTELKTIRDEIKSHIVSNGGIIANTNITQTQYFDNANVTSANAYYCDNNSVKSNHEVLIIGWDDNYSRNNFNASHRPSSDGAYLVLNSYGEGDNEGCYYISYEDILIESDLIGIVSTTDREYKNIYQYDELGPSVSYWPTLMDLETGEVGKCSELYAANVYSKKETGAEYITEIGLNSLDDVVADIYVLANASTLNINNATLVASNVSLSNGYKTIKLTSPIQITGSKFAVIAKYKDSEELIIPLEANLTDNPQANRSNDLWDTAESKSGQSMYSLDGKSGNWKDFNNVWTNTNFCIKAFTKTSDSAGPTITFGTNGSTTEASSHSTTITVSDSSGVNSATLKYVWTQSTSTPSNDEFVNNFKSGDTATINIENATEGTWYLWVQAKDQQGNKTTARSNGFNLIDDSPDAPVLSSSTPSGQLTNQAVYINLIEPAESDGYTYKYSINGGDTWNNVPSSKQIEIDRVGEFQIVAKSINSEGKESAYSNVWIVKINRTVPVIDGVKNNGVYSDPVTPTISDDLSYTIVLQKDGTQISYTEGQPISEGGKYVLTVTDEAGNQAIVNFTIDNGTPIVSFSPNGSTTYTKEQSVKISVADDSGLAFDGLKYLWSTEATGVTEEKIKSEGLSINNNATVEKASANGTWYVWVWTQDATNKSTVARSNPFYFDNEKPEINITYDSDTSNRYAVSHDVTINVTDASQKYSKLKYVWTQTLEEPEESEFNSDFTNSEKITKTEVTGNWYLWVMAIDEAGNKTVTSSKVLKFDNDIPEKPIISANIENGSATNQEVELTITGNSTISGLKNYEISSDGGKNWKEIESGIRVTTSTEGEYHILARTVNSVGTKGEISDEFVFTIDKTNPNIIYPQEGMEYVEVVPEIEDNTAITVVLKKDGSVINYTYDNKIEENGEYELTVTDEAGNTSKVNFTISNEYPKINFTTNGNSNYSKEHKTVVNVVDDDLNEESLQYVWTQSTTEPRANIEWINFTNGQEIVKNTESGTWYLWVKATDEAGNQATQRTEGFNLDNEVQEIPTINANIENNETTNKDVEITLNVKETLSGLNKYQYSIDNGTKWNDVNKNVITLKEEGSYNIIVRAINNVGTISEESEEFSVKVDKTNPIINNIEDGKTYDEVIIDVEDNSEFEIILLKDGQEVSCKNGDSITTPGVYTLTVIDKAKNQTSVSFSIEESEPEVDNQGPIVSFSSNGNENYAKNQSTVINVTDISQLDEASLKYLWKDNTNTPEEEDFIESFENGDEIVLENVSGKYYLWVMAKDTLGNTTVTRSNVFYIDNTIPTTPEVEIIQNEEDNTYTVKVSGSVSESKVTYQYTTDDGETWNNLTGNQLIISNEGTTNISFRSINEVGNVSEVTDNFEIVIEEIKDIQPDPNPDDEENNQGNGQENNSNNGQNNNVDDTVSKAPIPQTGIQNIFVIVLIITGIIVAVIVYIKSKKLI